MKEGGWRAFRDASKHKAMSATAADELERPAVSHRISLPPADAPPPAVHETVPAAAPAPDHDAAAPENAEAGETANAPDADAAAEDQDPVVLFRQSMRLMTPSWPEAAAGGRLRYGRAALAALKRHWYVAAIVPVAGGASLLAVWAGLNPYALCLQWWDFVYGSVFLAASLVFVGLAIWKGPRGAWHPGAPALAVVIGIVPFWVATNFTFGTACQEAVAAQGSLVPPLPPPIEVEALWTVPVPMPRPPELDYNFTPQQLDLRTDDSIQLHPPSL